MKREQCTTVVSVIVLSSLVIIKSSSNSHQKGCPWGSQLFRAKRDEPVTLKLPVGTIYGYADQQPRSAFKFEFANFNAKDFKFKLQLLENITNTRNSCSLANSLCDQMATGVFLFFGSKDTKSAETIESFTRQFHVPYVCPCLTKVVNPLKNFQIHMKPPFTMAIVDMIRHYRWRNMIYLYDSTEGLQRFNEVMSAFYEDMSNKETMLAIRLYDVNQAHDQLRFIDSITFRYGDADIRNIIFDLSSQEAYELIMKQLAEVGMNKEGYFFLFATMDFSKLNFEHFVHGGVNVTGFDLINPEEPKVKAFLRKWRTANQIIYPAAGQPLMSEAALAVDAMELITTAFKRMLAKNKHVFQANFRRTAMYNFYGNVILKGIQCFNNEHGFIPWQHGENILKELKSAEFSGLTGPVAFNEDGYRKNFEIHVSRVGLNQPPLRIGKWARGRFRLVGADENNPFQRNMTRRDGIIRITTIMVAPFLQYKKDADLRGNSSDPNYNDRFEGFIVDLTKKIAERLDLKYRFQLVHDNQYGRQDTKTGKWNGIIGELLNGTADMAVAPLTITLKRENVVDFTKPFMEVGISIMIKKPEIEKPGVFSFMKPFSIQIWMFILLAYIAVSVGLFFVCRASPFEWRKLIQGTVLKYENEFSLVNTFWFSAGALMLQGSDSCPRSLSGRVIGTVWWFFVLIIISTYTANLAAFLTIERLVTPIASADDLAAQTDIKYGTVRSGSTREFFEMSKVPTFRKMGQFMKYNDQYNVKTVSEGIKRVRDSKGKYAFLLESTSNEYANSREPCDTMKVGRNLNSKGFGIATPLNSPLRDVLNLAVLELKEEGTLHRLKRRWWNDKSQCAQDNQETSGKRSLSLSNVAGVFYILIGGLVLAVLFGAFEVTLKRLQLVPKHVYTLKDRGSSEVKLLRTPSERENGTVSDYGINSPDFHNDEMQDNEINHQGFSGCIGFEAFGDGNAHTDV
ncbi:glutamate receptor 2-like [Saccostrea echinata]|uniref:glutamate receptor 2-like n=1 Tax=Saccostrea echinata TaxID=191078 RepID=UPI002A82EDC0|nr:glutamate receptor 2-like [Saccostrea echinata]